MGSFLKVKRGAAEWKPQGEASWTWHQDPPVEKPHPGQQQEQDLRRGNGTVNLHVTSITALGDAVWDLPKHTAHVYFSLRLISIIMWVYTKSREGRGPSPKLQFMQMVVGAS